MNNLHVALQDSKAFTKVYETSTGIKMSDAYCSAGAGQFLTYSIKRGIPPYRPKDDFKDAEVDASMSVADKPKSLEIHSTLDVIYKFIPE